MPIIEEFSTEMIQTFLESRGLEYQEVSGASFVVQETDEETGCNLSIWLNVVPSRTPAYLINIYSDRRFPLEAKPQLLAVCNTWNDEQSIPTAIVNEDAEKGVGEILFSQMIRLGPGIHQELFDDFTLSAINGARRFWSQLHNR